MAMRVFGSSTLRSSYKLSKILLSNPTLNSRISLGDLVCKVIVLRPVSGRISGSERLDLDGHRRWIHSTRYLGFGNKAAEPTSGLVKTENVEGVGGGDGFPKVKRMKLKGRRAVVRWLKFFRWQKKKQFQRMTPDEKVLYKLRRAQKKEERLVVALKKIEPKELSETIHDPEILTPEEHFFFLKMGLKCRNYVPIGRRGISSGVILNMHLHWKKHQTLLVIVKTFTREEVKEMAKELARLSGGIVLDIHDHNMIIMYRGKNYSQPPTEIMSPRETLSRRKALDKSKYREGLRAVRQHIPKLEQELQLLQARAKNEPISVTRFVEEETLETYTENIHVETQSQNSDKVHGIYQRSEDDDNGVNVGLASDLDSDSEDLSDVFETDSEIGAEENLPRTLYLEEFDKFPAKSDGELEDFEDHLRRVSLVDLKKDESSSEDACFNNYDEIDRLFLRAASLFKKKVR